MDEFELAGFDEETCEQLRKISFESGIEPYRLIDIARQYKTDLFVPLDEYGQLGFVWDVFKLKMWDEFINSKFGKFMIRLADKLEAWLGRFGK